MNEAVLTILQALAVDKQQEINDLASKKLLIDIEQYPEEWRDNHRARMNAQHCYNLTTQLIEVLNR